MEISKSGLFYHFSTMMMPSEYRRNINSPCELFFGTFTSFFVLLAAILFLCLYFGGAINFFEVAREMGFAKTNDVIPKHKLSAAVYFAIVHLVAVGFVILTSIGKFLDKFTFIRASGLKCLPLDEVSNEKLYVIKDTSLVAKLGWDNYDSSETRKSGSQILDGISVPLIIAFCAFSVASVFVSGFLTGISGEFAFSYDTFFQNGLIGCAFFGAVGYSLYLMCSKSTLTE